MNSTLFSYCLIKGDVYYGRFTEVDRQTNIPKRTGFGWFKVVDAGEGSLLITMSTQMSTTHKPSTEMSSADFESELIPMKIKNQENYQIDLISEDGSIEMSFSEKK